MKKGRWLLISFMAASVLFGAYYLWREEFPDPPKEVVQTFAVQVEQSSVVAVETQKPPGLHFESSRNSLPL